MVGARAARQADRELETKPVRTFSHAIFTAALGQKATANRSNLFAFVAGSVMPDLPLILLTAISMLSTPTWAEGMKKMHSTYETDALWIALHNLPHSLVALGLMAAFAGALSRRWRTLLLWFVAGAALHSVVDILTHAGDGPMFLYPLSGFRFDSPVSYWDPAYYGRAFTRLEYLLDVILALYLVLELLKRQSSNTVDATSKTLGQK